MTTRRNFFGLLAGGVASVFAAPLVKADAITLAPKTYAKTVFDTFMDGPRIIDRSTDALSNFKAEFPLLYTTDLDGKQHASQISTTHKPSRQ